MQVLSCQFFKVFLKQLFIEHLRVIGPELYESLANNLSEFYIGAFCRSLFLQLYFDKFLNTPLDLNYRMLHEQVSKLIFS